MNNTTFTTKAGNAYDVSWPGDTRGGGGKPAIAIKKRIEFIEDVRGEGQTATAMTTPELRKKWGKLLSSDRTLTKWTSWAKGLTAVVV